MCLCGQIFRDDQPLRKNAKPLRDTTKVIIQSGTAGETVLSDSILLIIRVSVQCGGLLACWRVSLTSTFVVPNTPVEVRDTQRWHPDTLLLEAAKELVFSKSMKVQEFKEQLSAMCDPPMPEDNIALSTLGCCCCRCEGEGFGDSCCTACVCVAMASAKLFGYNTKELNGMAKIDWSRRE